MSTFGTCHKSIYKDFHVERGLKVKTVAIVAYLVELVHGFFINVCDNCSKVCITNNMPLMSKNNNLPSGLSFREYL